MKDEIISFETAKLAREKGLIERLKCNYVYCIGWSNKKSTIMKKEELMLSPRISVKSQFHLALAPTQSLLQKWLRERNIVILVEIAKYQNNYQSRIIDYQQPFTNPKFTEIFDNYEDALEQGLVIGLNLIKNEKEIS